MTKCLPWIITITLTEKQPISKCFQMVHRCYEQNSVSEKFAAVEKLIQWQQMLT